MKYIIVLIISLYTSALFACDKESTLPDILGSIVHSDAIKNVVLVQTVKGPARWYMHGDTIEPNYKIIKINKYSTLLQTGSSVHEVVLSNCSVSTELDNPHLYLAQISEQDMYDENNINTELLPGQSRIFFSQPPEPHRLETNEDEIESNEKIKKGEERVFFKPPVDVKEMDQSDEENVTKNVRSPISADANN